MLLSHFSLPNQWHWHLAHLFQLPKGGQGCLITPPCLESQGCHLIPLYCLLSRFSASSSYSFRCISFLPTGPCCRTFLRKFFNIFHYDIGLAARRSKLVSGMWHAAIWHWYLLLCIYIIFPNFLLLLSIPFLSFFKNLVLINRRNGPWYQRVLTLCAFFFFNRGNTEQTNSLKILCSMFVYVLFYVNLCLGWLCHFLRICRLVTCVHSK